MSKFSNLYSRKTFDICRNDEILFQITVSEITTRAKEDIQRENMKGVDMNVTGYSKKGAQREIQRRISERVKEVDAVENTVRTTILPAIVEWTLTDDNGKVAPIIYETWAELPAFITKQIEKAVEELNPEQDEDFHGGSGDTD